VEVGVAFPYYFDTTIELAGGFFAKLGSWLNAVAWNVTHEPLWMGAAILLGLCAGALVLMRRRVAGD
jgi:hypothetical protein